MAVNQTFPSFDEYFMGMINGALIAYETSFDYQPRQNALWALANHYYFGDLAFLENKGFNRELIANTSYCRYLVDEKEAAGGIFAAREHLDRPRNYLRGMQFSAKETIRRISNYRDGIIPDLEASLRELTHDAAHKFPVFAAIQDWPEIFGIYLLDMYANAKGHSLVCRTCGEMVFSDTHKIEELINMGLLR